jgi:hypothetical protein
VKTLPVEYKFNKKAWMTSEIFCLWLRKLDRSFKAERGKVLMIVDNCPANPVVEKLEAIKLEFLPPNATSRLQPCDMGITNTVKVKYRRLIALRLIDAAEKKTTYEVNILHAMNMLRKREQASRNKQSPNVSVRLGSNAPPLSAVPRMTLSAQNLTTNSMRKTTCPCHVCYRRVFRSTSMLPSTRQWKRANSQMMTTLWPTSLLP